MRRRGLFLAINNNKAKPKELLFFRKISKISFLKIKCFWHSEMFYLLNSADFKPPYFRNYSFQTYSFYIFLTQ